MADKLALFIDLDRCWGCGTCEVACALEKGFGPGRGCIKVTEIAGAGDPGGLAFREFVPIPCQHCDEAACMAACPAEALGRSEEGAVVLDPERCLSCGACEEACPYGAISLSPTRGLPEKCDLCLERRAAGRLPACVQHCPGRAISVVDPGTLKARVVRGRVIYLSRSGRPRS